MYESDPFTLWTKTLAWPTRQHPCPLHTRLVESFGHYSFHLSCSWSTRPHVVPPTNRNVPTSVPLPVLVPASCKDLPHGLYLTNSFPAHMLHLLQEALCDLLCPSGLGYQCPFWCFHISQLLPLYSPQWAKMTYTHNVITTPSSEPSSGPGTQQWSRESWLKERIKTHFPSGGWFPPIFPWPSLRLACFTYCHLGAKIATALLSPFTI